MGRFRPEIPTPLLWVAAAGGAGFAILAGAGIAASAPGYRGRITDHFDGRIFRNVPPTDRLSASEVVRWLVTRRPPRWTAPPNARPGPPPPREVRGDAMRITLVGHATALVQVEGFHFLTDPIWSERPGPANLLGPRRVRPPGIRFEDLPRIDAVLLSHDHYDHLDLATLRRLQARHRSLIFAGLGNRALLERAGIDGAVDLDWWQEAQAGSDVTVACVPARHFSGRGVLDGDASLWAGFVVRTASGSVFFAGDTGEGPHFAEIRRRLGSPRLALLPIGAYLPRPLMEKVHLSPTEAIDAHLALGAHTSVGIHYGTFRLADEARDEPPIELARAIAERPGAEAFRILPFGEGYDVPSSADARPAAGRSPASPVAPGRRPAPYEP